MARAQAEIRRDDHACNITDNKQQIDTIRSEKLPEEKPFLVYRKGVDERRGSLLDIPVERHSGYHRDDDHEEYPPARQANVENSRAVDHGLIVHVEIVNTDSIPYPLKNHHHKHEPGQRAGKAIEKLERKYFFHHDYHSVANAAVL